MTAVLAVERVVKTQRSAGERLRDSVWNIACIPVVETYFQLNRLAGLPVRPTCKQYA